MIDLMIWNGKFGKIWLLIFTSSWSWQNCDNPRSGKFVARGADRRQLRPLNTQTLPTMAEKRVHSECIPCHLVANGRGIVIVRFARIINGYRYSTLLFWQKVPRTNLFDNLPHLRGVVT